MTTEPAKDIRNFAVVGHASCGKTMLSEAMLACSGTIGRMGRIADGSTVSDYHPSEKQRQISTQASLLHATWTGKKFNIIDSPGYLDFAGEALSALRVADLAVVVIHARDGVGVGTERVWNYASERGLPKFIVVNQLDKLAGDFDEKLAALRERYGAGLFPLSLPVNAGAGFNQVLDIMRNTVDTYDISDGHGKYREEPAEGALKERITRLHTELIEHIAESDDTLLTKFFEKGGLSEDEFRAGIHDAVQKQHFIPLFCTAAETGVGVARLMDIIAKYGPTTLDSDRQPAIDANDAPVEVRLADDAPVIQIFKTMAEEHFGELSFFRVYSGIVRSGMELFNANHSKAERIGQIYILNGRERTPVPELRGGDIGALVKLKGTHTGDTLCLSAKPVRLPKVEYPRPTIHAALVATVKGEEDKVAAGLAALHEEDPTFLHRVDSELHQTVISAQGELHLEVVIDRLRRRFNVHVELGEPRIPFRETIAAPADSRYRHKKQTGGAGQFAEVWMKIEPLPRDSGVDFTESLSGQNVDRVFVPSVEEGVQNACREGVLAGYKVVDVKIDFYDGKMHPVDSKDIAFQIAGYFAFKEAFLKARPHLLEPIHQIEVRIPDDCLGKVMGDISSRRGRILGVDADGPFQTVKALVPARELYRYSSTLRALTAGRGVHSENFDHYQEMPRDMEQKVVEESKKKKAEASAK